jgi:hypothetical protein
MVDNPGRYFDAFDEGSGGGMNGKGLELEIVNIQRAGYWYLAPPHHHQHHHHMHGHQTTGAATTTIVTADNDTEGLNLLIL